MLLNYFLFFNTKNYSDTNIHGSSTVITTSDPHPSSIITTFPPTRPIATDKMLTYLPTTFSTTITIYFPGYTTTYIITISYSRTTSTTPTQVYIPPSTVVVITEVTALYAVETDPPTSDAGDSINNLNMWKDKLSRMIICLWTIGVAFVCANL
jgi:hypothetical protein